MAELNEEQLEDMKECYSIFDKKGDMKVESEAIINVLRSLGLNPLAEDVNKVLKDSNLEGQRVDFETFAGLYSQFAKAPSAGTYEDLMEGLKTFDRDSSGMITAAEFRHMLVNMADKLTEEQAEKIIKPNEDANLKRSLILKL